MSRFGASPRTPALRSGCSGASLFGGRKESSPQLRAPPRSFGVRPRTTPLLVFISEFVLTLEFRDSYYGGAQPLVMDALAEMSEAQMQMRLTHPPVRAQARSQRTRGMRARLPLTKHRFQNYILFCSRNTNTILDRIAFRKMISVI